MLAEQLLFRVLGLGWLDVVLVVNSAGGGGGQEAPWLVCGLPAFVSPTRLYFDTHEP